MRATLDKLISWTGLILAAVLIVASGLMWWASSFIHDNVAQQLADQHITMPADEALTEGHMKDNLSEFAGQKMTTGEQAKAYADHYILAHMDESSGGRTYSEVSGEFMGMMNDPNADPEALAELGQLRQTMFMGSTLRGLLLNAYAFDTVGTIMGYGAIAAGLGALLLAALGLLGLRHAAIAAAGEGTAAPRAMAS